jgi:hypothetical protein
MTKNDDTIVGKYVRAPCGYPPYPLVPYRVQEASAWTYRLSPLDARSYALGMFKEHVREMTLYDSEAEVRAALIRVAA